MIAARCLSARAPMRLAAAAALALAFGVAAAQTQAPTPKPTPDEVRQRGQELDAIQAEQQKADAAQQKLRDEIAALGEDRRKLNQALLDGAASIRSDEDKIPATKSRLQQLAGTEAGIRKSLDSRRAVIGEVLAVLQRMGRRPPPAMLVKPEDALESLRAAMLLGAVVPEMRGEVQSLAAQLTDLVHVRTQAASERDALIRDRASLAHEQLRMSLLIGERQKRQAAAQQQLDAAHQHAADLARQASTLKDLIAKLEQSAPPPANDHTAHSNLSALKDPGRLEPAIAFASAKGMLPIPVSGVKSRDFGSSDGNGGTEKGISIVTRPSAQVTSPCDGWVVYAAPYRSYGKLLILNAGGGYLVVLAGMEQISVDIGQFVLTGEPVAAMGSGPEVASSAATSTGGSQPALYIEFRKDGTPVDPNPWWATPGSEKVRG